MPAAFIDKTLLIKTVLDRSPIILLTAPHMFGKSVNLSMLKRFFEILDDEGEQRANRVLFGGLLIEKEQNIMDNHCGKYPVIFLDFESSYTIWSLSRARALICSAVGEAYQQHKYLASSDKLEDYEKEKFEKWRNLDFMKNPVEEDQHIYDALENLAEYLKKHWKKNVMVLVDEYDYICRQSIISIIHYDAETEINRIIALFEGTLSCLLKDNKNVGRSIITGISYLSMMGLSNLNTVEVIKFQEDSDFAPFYGLTLDECKNLLSKFELDSEYDNVLLNYGGYRNNMSNIWSVMNYVTKREPDSYWIEWVDIPKSAKVFTIIHFRSLVCTLTSHMANDLEIQYYSKIGPQHIREFKKILAAANENEDQLDIYFNFLLELGFLKIDSFNKDENIVKVKLPNEEIRIEFLEKFSTSLGFASIGHFKFHT